MSLGTDRNFVRSLSIDIFRSILKRFLAPLAVLVLVLGWQGPAAAGALLVGDYNTGNILRYDATTGAFVDVFASNAQMAGPVTLSFGPDGNLYVAGEISGNVTRFDGQTGAFIDTFVPNGTGGLITAHGLTFGPDQNLYVTGGNGNVLRYNGSTGAFIDTFVAPHSGGLRNAEDLRFGPDGNFYVAGGDTDSVLRYDGTTGAFSDVFASGGGLLLAAASLFGPDGNLYVDSFFTNQVLRYNGTTGAFIDVFASGGGLSSPNKLTFGPDGNLYVAGEGSGVNRYNGTTGAFIDNFVPKGSGGLDRAVGLIFAPETPAQLITDLIAVVDALNFKRGVRLLRTCLKKLNSGKTRVACNKLSAFKRLVAAQSGKKLTTTQAAQLIASATQIQTALSCP